MNIVEFIVLFKEFNWKINLMDILKNKQKQKNKKQQISAIDRRVN